MTASQNHTSTNVSEHVCKQTNVSACWLAYSSSLRSARLACTGRFAAKHHRTQDLVIFYPRSCVYCSAMSRIPVFSRGCRGYSCSNVLMTNAGFNSMELLLHILYSAGCEALLIFGPSEQARLLNLWSIIPSLGMTRRLADIV